MLTLKLSAIEEYDEASSRFINTWPEMVLELEHSLVSLSKWESIWEKPFLGKEEKSTPEVMSYVECMMISSNIPPGITDRLTREHFEQIQEYIESKQSATWFNDTNTGRPPSKEIITAEVIYHWMIAHNIPSEYDRWHLRKLITLIEVCNKKNQPAKKGRPTTQSLSDRARLNAERKKQFNTTG